MATAKTAAELAALEAAAVAAAQARARSGSDKAAQFTALVVAHAAARDALSRSAVAATATELRRFRQWTDRAAIKALVKRIVPRVETVQRRTASLTDAYLARVASLQKGSRVSPVGPVDVTHLRGDIPHDDVYGRLADQYRYLLSTDVSAEVAQERVIARGELLAETDATLAMRAQSRKFMVVRQVDGFRRIIHPELSHKTGVCGLCIIAADRLYHIEELLPIHSGCNCTVSPVINGVDPGLNLNADDLAAVYKAAGSNRAKDLIAVRVKVEDHGELGPILTDASHAWRSATQVARDTGLPAAA